MSSSNEAGKSAAPESFVPPTPEELERLLPHFAIRELIAHGGMGAVYSAVQKGLDRPVAIKILPPDAGRDRESLDRFRTEAKAMARLTHPHIPAVFDFAVVEEFCVLVMELVAGPTVYTLIQQGNLKPPQALEILAQVCDAVQFAHSRGIIHGDIKPGNILINQDGQVKLADFGLARLMEQGNRDSESWTPMGTPEYAAPELYDKNGRPDHRADIYSLGIVLHEMLTGTTPAGEFELPGAALKLDPRVDGIIARCLEFPPDARFQSAGEIRNVLRDIIDGRNVPPARPLKKSARRSPAAAPGRGKAAPATAARTGSPQHSRPRNLVVKGPARMTPGLQRNLLAGSAILVLAVAALLIATRNGKPAAPPGDAAPAAPTPPSPVTPLPESTTRSSPPAPEPKEVPPPPKPEPGSAVPKATPPAAALARLRELRITFRDEWNARIESKIGDEMTRLGNLYGKALQGLEDKLLAKGDTVSAGAVRAESGRFAGNPVPAPEVSSLPELARLQQSLASQVSKLRAGLKFDADAIKEKYLLALKALERELDQNGDAGGSRAADAGFQAAAGLTDTGLRDYFNQE